jgi:hypothetical protein
MEWLSFKYPSKRFAGGIPLSANRKNTTKASNGGNMGLKNGVTGLLAAGVLLFVAGLHAHAATNVFVIQHDSTQIARFSLSGSNVLTRQSPDFTGGLEGGTGLAYDPYLARVLETCENGDQPLVKVFNANSPAEQPATIAIPAGGEISGIVADTGKQKVYITTQGDNHLFVLNWDAAQSKYVLESTTPHELADSQTHVFGIALDEINGRLYAADGTQTIRCYSTANWSHLYDVTITDNAVAIAVDCIHGYLYAGTMNDDSNPMTYYLTRYNLNTHIETRKNVNDVVMGVAVEQTSDILYASIFGNDANDVRMYRPSDLAQVGPTPTVSVTVPSGIAAGNAKPSIMGISITEDVSGCASLGNIKYFTITLSPNGATHPNTMLRLYVSGDPNLVVPIPGSIFDPVQGGWKLSLGTVSGAPLAFHYGVAINTSEDPGNTILSIASAESDISYSIARRQTQICCDSGSIIYVRADGPAGNGVSWANSYNDLNKALRRAGYDCTAKTVWVAQGIYSPGSSPAMSFVVPAGVSVVGGLMGYESSTFDLSQRNLDFVQTILTGESANTKVVTMGSGALLNGLTVVGGKEGIEGLSTDFTVEKCKIEGHAQDGIYCENGSPTVRWCTVSNNGWNGIYAYASTSYFPTTTVTNSRILRNGQNGLYAKGGTSIVKNSVIGGNGFVNAFLGGEKFCGISMDTPATRPLIRNCTVVNNAYYGVYRYENWPPDMAKAPEVRNCILWGNWQSGSTYGRQYEGGMGVWYSCVMNWTDSNSCTNLNPQFAYSDPNTPLGWHILPNSPCKNTGCPPATLYTGEKDIDNQDRVYDGTVDMGADEVTCEDIYNPLDWNHDGLVNLKEFAIFANAWQSHSPQQSGVDPNLCVRWNETVNLNPDYVIDFKDLRFFCQGYQGYAGYPWMACWHPPIPPIPAPPVTVTSSGMDPNIPYDPNAPIDPNTPEDPNGYSMMSVGGGMNQMALRTSSLETTAAEAQQLGDTIDFLYEAAADDPDAANSIYEFIGTLEQELSDIYGTLPGYNFTQ